MKTYLLIVVWSMLLWSGCATLNWAGGELNVNVFIDGEFRSAGDPYYLNKLPAYIRPCLKNLRADAGEPELAVVHLPLISYGENNLPASLSNAGQPLLVIDEFDLIREEYELANAGAKTPVTRRALEAILSGDDSGVSAPRELEALIQAMPRNDRMGRFTTFIEHYNRMMGRLVTETYCKSAT